jgi:hypothetical protein
MSELDATPEANPSHWRRTPSIIARRVAGETVLIPLARKAEDPEAKSARLYVFNETAEYLWSLLEAPQSAAELARNLTLQFETTAVRARADVDAFLLALRDIGAVSEVTGAGAE